MHVHEHVGHRLHPRDRWGDADDVFVAARFSEHGFKRCSVVGRIVAEFCLDQLPSWDIRRFGLTPARGGGLTG